MQPPEIDYLVGLGGNFIRQLRMPDGAGAAPANWGEFHTATAWVAALKVSSG